MSNTLKTPEPKEILEQFIIFGQHQRPFKCARCGASTEDKEQRYCWCTDRDTSPNYEPNWIENIDYPRYVKAQTEALKQLEAYYAEYHTNRLSQ